MKEDPDEVEDIEFGVDPDSATDELCDQFCIELDPIRDLDFLRRLTSSDPATWVRLEDICDGLPQLPDGADEILRQVPDRVVLCHFGWAGADMHEHQPSHVVVVGDTLSMYHRMMLVDVPSGRSA